MNMALSALYNGSRSARIAVWRICAESIVFPGDPGGLSSW